MNGPGIIARTLSGPRVTSKKDGSIWQYHSRSDDHSKVACWAVLFDVLQQSSLLRTHVAAGKVAFGINRQINDWSTGRRKNLDLVVARHAGQGGTGAFDLVELATRWKIDLTAAERGILADLPTSPGGTAGATVLVALEAKACMTEHRKARPRLYDELTSSHATVHGDNAGALAIGLVMLNAGATFVSPGRQGQGDAVVSHHTQPAAAAAVMDKLREINRRPGSGSQQAGFDAFGVVIVDMANDGTPVTLVSLPPAPGPSDDFHYDRMVTRAAHLYDTSFGNI